MKYESDRMQAVQSPIIPIIGELIQRYPGTISLGQGVAYYSPPPEAIAQLSHFLSDPENHKYKSVQGIAPLQEAIAQKLQQENGIPITDQNCVVVTAGSNMGFMNALLAIASPGDEIILQTPYYFNHEMAVTIASCRPVLVATDEHYQLRPDAIRAAITHRTKAIVTISPNNPTGAVYSQAALQAVNQMCREHGIYHISDEAYEYFTYDGVPHISPGAFPDSADYTISLYTLSKAYGFASWRIGYMVIPRHLLNAVKKIQDTVLICPPVISQFAALGALQAGVTYCKTKLEAIAQIRQTVLAELDTISHLCTVPLSQGAFYCLVRVHLERDALELAEQLIREHGVAVIPGNAFGIESGCYLRIAYGALQQDTAIEGIGRFVYGLKAITSSGS
ncbi:pyridoxal phosphate-dependent aminotransferase [Oscillatoria sp. FACHB-1407]|uniref:pyridoxal phosphate-dependent aminotransferase n=1 Tax=Oscillatoria sp. FACHB-1407 TaxID=2692847 RepID=UPI00168879E5|nr:pyridoxal phosphate-dependent aminotransferase [Oscillatoria sp. FACHB-1407]MBD2464031.1 pyridoxal phosphate-dependent aminotransferase [Oscillatoria sp. FACHB-1407]